jgi:flagellar biosynthesis/type III secretory pathway protein FliH
MSSHLLRIENDIPAVLSGSVLKAADALKLADAERVLVAARDIEARSKEEAAKEAELQRQEGHRKGLQEGLLEARLHNLETVAATSKMISGLHHQICDVVTTCLRTLLKDMPPAQRIEQAAMLALETVNLQQTVVLCVNPTELREAVPVSQKLSELMSGGARVECRGREDVEPGDCLLETPMGIIRCALEDQLALINKALHNAQE